MGRKISRLDKKLLVTTMYVCFPTQEFPKHMWTCKCFTGISKNVFSKSPLGMGTHQIALHKIGGLHSGGTDISYIFITTVTVGVHQMMSVKHAHILQPTTPKPHHNLRLFWTRRCFNYLRRIISFPRWRCNRGQLKEKFAQISFQHYEMTSSCS